MELWPHNSNQLASQPNMLGLLHYVILRSLSDMERGNMRSMIGGLVHDQLDQQFEDAYALQQAFVIVTNQNRS